MDFNFRSIHQRSSTYFTPSPNLPSPSPSNISHSTHQDIRAPQLSHPEFGRNPEELREAMQFQRELEKERIRAEIIAEEISRRSILENEVRREMMMEREMQIARFGASDPMWLEPRPSLLANYDHRERFGGFGVSPYRETRFRGFETLPFQRDPTASEVANENGIGVPSSVNLPEIKVDPPPDSEVNKGKVIVLAKPTMSVADLKRKAAKQPDGATAELITGSSTKKQKTKYDWSCAMCRVSATSEQGLSHHLQGRRHKSRERGLLSERIGFATTSVPKKIILTNSKDIKATGSEGSPSSKNKKEKAVASKKMKKKKEWEEKMKNRKAAMANKTGESAKPNEKFRLWCELCKVEAYNQKTMDRHNNGKRHLKALSNVNQTSETETTPGKTSTENVETEQTKQVTIPGESTKLEEKFRFWCELCKVELIKVGAYCQKAMDQHKNGKRHLEALSKVNQVSEIKTPGKTSTENVETKQTKQATIPGKTSTDNVETEQTKQEIVGAFCQKAMDQHKNGKRHLETLSKVNQTNETKTPGKTLTKNVETKQTKATIPGKTSTENVETEQTKQEILGAYCQKAMYQHKNARRHLEALSKVNQTSETKTPSKTSTESVETEQTKQATIPGKTSTENVKTEQTKHEFVGEEAEIKEERVENNPTKIDLKDTKPFETDCKDIVAVVDGNDQAVPDNGDGC